MLVSLLAHTSPVISRLVMPEILSFSSLWHSSLTSLWDIHFRLPSSPLPQMCERTPEDTGLVVLPRLLIAIHIAHTPLSQMWQHQCTLAPREVGRGGRKSLRRRRCVSSVRRGHLHRALQSSTDLQSAHACSCAGQQGHCKDLPATLVHAVGRFLVPWCL